MSNNLIFGGVAKSSTKPDGDAHGDDDIGPCVACGKKGGATLTPCDHVTCESCVRAHLYTSCPKCGEKLMAVCIKSTGTCHPVRTDKLTGAAKLNL